MSMELRHLRYFVAVADELSFTRAAATLHVAQSAVSSQIKLLEEEVGVPLFERSSRRVDLTPAGRVLLAGSRAMLEGLREVVRQSRRVGLVEAGELAIGFIGSQSHEWLPQVLRRFRRKFPGVDVTLRELVPSEQLEALLLHRLDLGIIGVIDGKPPPGIQMETIAEERPIAAVPADHILAKREFLRLAELKSEPFVFTSRENAPSYRAWFARLCHRAGFTPRIVQEVDRARTGVQYIAAGFGVSVFSEHVSRWPAPGVTFIPLRPIGLKLRFGVAWRKEGNQPLVNRFIEYTKEQIGPLEAEELGR
jgi:DNA-binding transcriptional LysR family regulator